MGKWLFAFGFFAMTARADFIGVDEYGERCEVLFTSSYRRPYVTLITSEYELHHMQVFTSPKGLQTVKAKLIEDRDGVYRERVGERLSGLKIGVIELSGPIIFGTNGEVQEIVLKAKGGLFNLWNGRFVCRRVS